ncbi:TIR domain-containing protein [Flavobacterium xinjiangense]|uniref:MTH538 TIR-like domain n=1 Tax=Flavobacterium xinjiangense TaxID=178356 RepID=A0A1M7P718_9FLAO|nr:TIR domain-containing protein [Flavobacterium xinjiangense]SHN12453.1 MTH538 TIR-like domain [Flavobacterium xinjiangense]
MAKTHTIFISHSWKYHKDLENLKNLLQNRGYFNVEFEEASRDTPINSNNATYIKQRLKTKITNSDVILGIAGVYATYSDWMKWELDTAYVNNIPIIGVIPRGQLRMSAIVNDKSITNVKWNTESIVEAIRKYSK